VSGWLRHDGPDPLLRGPQHDASVAGPTHGLESVLPYSVQFSTDSGQRDSGATGPIACESTSAWRAVSRRQAMRSSQRFRFITRDLDRRNLVLSFAALQPSQRHERI
jgi:hypothetical protein